MQLTHGPRSSPLNPVGSSGFASLASARSAQPHCGSPMLAATSQAYTVRRNAGLSHCTFENTIRGKGLRILKKIYNDIVGRAAEF